MKGFGRRGAGCVRASAAMTNGQGLEMCALPSGGRKSHPPQAPEEDPPVRLICVSEPPWSPKDTVIGPRPPCSEPAGPH